MISLRLSPQAVSRIDLDKKKRQSRSEYVRVAIEEKLQRGEEE
jgi:Arc/MetJ-type ribon-helix-helix transcriptional regulator